MQLDRDALKDYINQQVAQELAQLDESEIQAVLEAGKRWKLGPTLQSGGAVVFPHAGIATCGHQIAAAVHACLDSSAERALVIGVLHALSDELQEARVRVAEGADVSREKHWGIQGPGFDRGQEWRDEFSLKNFLFLWQKEIERRGIDGPELVLCYPYLAGGKPEILPGIERLQELAETAVIVSTADPFHHGIGYGDPPDVARSPEDGGLELARKGIEEGLALIKAGDYWGYNQHCVEAKSDARDAGQVMRYLLGPLEGSILDLTYQDTTEMYDQPAPTWVATALIEMRSIT